MQSARNQHEVEHLVGQFGTVDTYLADKARRIPFLAMIAWKFLRDAATVTGELNGIALVCSIVMDWQRGQIIQGTT
jgi:hypothetical protein